MARDNSANAGLSSVLKVTMISELRQEAAHRDVRKLRNLYVHGRMTHAEIAEELGVGRSTISETMKRLGISSSNRKPRHVAGRGLPYGMQLIDGAITASPAERRAIKMMAELRRDGRSYRAIAIRLNASGIPTKTGRGVWAASTIMGIIKRSHQPSQTS